MNIVISGTVGVGKSTVSKKVKKRISEKVNSEVILIEEIQEDNILIDFYYKNRPSWTFLVQISFVFDRFTKAFKNNDKNKFYIFDRHFLDDYIFANLKSIKDDMNNLHWKTYSILNKELNNKLKENVEIDYFFLLKADFDKVLERIEKRGRKSEKKVDVDYWKDLYYQYYENEEIQKYIKGSVKKMVIVDTNNKSIESISDEIRSYIS